MKSGDLMKILEAERNSRISYKNPASRFIFRAYTDVIIKVQHSFNVTEKLTPAKIEKLRLTDGMEERLIKMLKQKIPKKSSKKTSLEYELTKYMGLGKVKARELVDAGLKSIEDLHQKKWFSTLPLETRTTLMHEPLRKIPHENIVKLESKLTGTSGYKTVLVGSYRRKTNYSKDIDVMVVSSKKDAISKYVNYLQKKMTKVVVYSLGEDKMSLIFKSPETKGKFYKVDAFLTSKKHEPGMLLYSTGSKMFNIRMRAKAKAKDYLLNQNGLHNRKTKRLLSVKTEKDFFKKLDMNYVVPEKR
jgi:DNA polymerase/3'-5' exonuclease PolX